MGYFISGKYYKLFFLVPIIIMMIVWFSVLLPGCKKKSAPSNTQYGYITYVVQWDNVLAKDAPKETLRFCFYPADNGPMIQTETNSDTLKIALAPGKYGLLAYNYGDNHIQLRNRSHFDNMEASFIPTNEGHSQTPAFPLYGIVIKEFEVKPNQDITESIAPTLFTKCVFFQIDIDKEDQELISNCQGTLAGVTPLLHVSDLTVKRETTTRLPLILEKTQDGYLGKVLLLDGYYSGDNADKISNEIILDFSLTDGNSIRSSINMGAALFNMKKQDILVALNADLDTTQNSSIRLECKSVEAYKRMANY